MNPAEIAFEIIYFFVPLTLLLICIFALFKKLNPARPLWAYTYLILTPLWIWLFPVGVLAIFGYGDDETSQALTLLHRIFGFIYLLELFLLLYLLVQILRSSAAPVGAGQPGTITAKTANTKRQLRYGAAATLTFGVICVLPAVLIALYVISAGLNIAADVAVNAEGGASALVTLLVMTLVLIFTPFGWVFDFLLIILTIYISWAVMAGTVLAAAFSLNGVIRFISLTKPFSIKHLLYILLLLVPVVNTVVLFRLSIKLTRLENTVDYQI